jgi:hypothetical protein
MEVGAHMDLSRSSRVPPGTHNSPLQRTGSIMRVVLCVKMKAIARKRTVARAIGTAAAFPRDSNRKS